MEAILAFLLTIQQPTQQPYTPAPISEAAADAIVEFWATTEAHIPENLSPRLGAAIKRFGEKHGLIDWKAYPASRPCMEWDGARVRYELEWLRSSLDSDLPTLLDAEELPTVEEIRFELSLARTQMNLLLNLAPIASPWEEDEVLRQYTLVKHHWIMLIQMEIVRDITRQAITRRSSLKWIKEMVGDRNWQIRRWAVEGECNGCG